MASIPEPQRARMFLAVSKSLGEEEAQTLTTALNLDGQLATRDELRTEIMSVREAVRDLDQRMTIGFADVDMKTADLDKRMTIGFADLSVRIADLETKLSTTSLNLFFQILGFQISAFGLAIAASKLL